MRNAVFILICLALAPFCRARTITVDDDGAADFNNIQAAIDDANDGDTVEIQPGTYTDHGNRDIDFLGKAITVRSTDPNDPNIVATTIIDCNGTEEDPHRGFYFHSAEDTESVVAGFSIINGYAPKESVWLGLDSCGGAIFCLGSAPEISNCAISGNCAGTSGGGLFCNESNPTIINCTIAGNLAGSDGGGMGNCRSSPTLRNCTFSANSAMNRGGGLFNFASHPTLINCVVSGNSAQGRGGGIEIYWCSGATLINSTFTANTASSVGGIWVSRMNHVTLTNSIFWGNTPPEIHLERASTMSATYSDIQGGCGGIGNIDVAPLFLDPNGGDYHLNTDFRRVLTVI